MNKGSTFLRSHCCSPLTLANIHCDSWLLFSFPFWLLLLKETAANIVTIVSPRCSKEWISKVSTRNSQIAESLRWVIPYLFIQDQTPWSSPFHNTLIILCKWGIAAVLLKLAREIHQSEMRLLDLSNPKSIIRSNKPEEMFQQTDDLSVKIPPHLSSFAQIQCSAPPILPEKMLVIKWNIKVLFNEKYDHQI